MFFFVWVIDSYNSCEIVGPFDTEELAIQGAVAQYLKYYPPDRVKDFEDILRIQGSAQASVYAQVWIRESRTPNEE